jgi:hypothetical protein
MKFKYFFQFIELILRRLFVKVMYNLDKNSQTLIQYMKLSPQYMKLSPLFFIENISFMYYIIFTSQVSNSLTLISPLAEFTYFLRLQIIMVWVLQAPIRSRLTDMFILSVVGLSYCLCHMVFCLEKKGERFLVQHLVFINVINNC